MSILSYNGGSILAMKGKECVAFATDMRLGSNQYRTIATNFDKIIRPSSKTLIGFSGLATDISTMTSLIKFKTNLYHLREEREIGVKALSHMTASILYGRRFSPYFVEPIVAGLDKDNVPYIAAFDLIGCLSVCNEFAISGTADNQLFGICESYYRPDLEPDELMEIISQCILSGIDRDAFSGWGVKVYLLTPKKLITKTLYTRQD
ncbi:proteasome component [Cryptosporidium ryanae]|uniref:proteasome component n=1 Tax=Cryptosporidium ryanae TaxID=515981 RepID=UPI003519FDC5|nr:proteasome component [Cryptosporidium ryanae]